jgi:uncharacterized protein
LALAAGDLSRPPARQWSARAELASIAGYRRWLVPVFSAAGVRCRFEPCCSRYAEDAIRAQGALIGTARALVRIARCGPWTAPGTLDPP